VKERGLEAKGTSVRGVSRNNAPLFGPLSLYCGPFLLDNLGVFGSREVLFGVFRTKMRGLIPFDMLFNIYSFHL
jgi:hypothetical protein